MVESVPNIATLQKGFVQCVACAKEIPLNSSLALEVSRCPSCNSQVFFPLKIKQYWLYKPLGGGGMGSVYVAISEKDNKLYALKILSRQGKNNQGFINAITHEGKVGHALGRHQNIIPVVDYGKEGDEHFIVSEFVSGDRLDVLVDDKKQLPEKEALEIMLQIVDAEMHICRSGYLFRDLKPENIIIEKSGNVRLFDYGLCASITDAASHANISDELDGSPFYIPPERIVGAPEGEYSEVYSLGMVLFYMLTGRTYYSEAEINDLVSKHVSSLRVLSVGSSLKHCSAGIVSVMDKMIARNPNKRYHELSMLKKDLEEKYNEAKNAYGALPPSTTEDVVRAVDKKKKLKILLAIGVPLFIIAVIYHSHSAYKQNQYRVELKKNLYISNANKLGTSVDVKIPDISYEEVKKKADDRIEQLSIQNSAMIPAFKENEIKASLMKSLNISSLPKEDPKPIEEIEKSMRAEMDSKILKDLGKYAATFNEDEEMKVILAELKIAPPLNDPALSLKDVEAEFKNYMQRKLDERFSTKILTAEVMELNKKFGPYRKGDLVEIIDAAGLPVKGYYGGRAGGKVIIGDRQILMNDIPAAVKWRFNEGEAEQKLQKVTEQHLDAFKKRKEDFKKEIETKEKTEFLAKYSYAASDEGSIKPIKVIAQERLEKDKKKFSETAQKLNKEVKEKVENTFNKVDFYQRCGYRNVDGKWTPVKDAFALLFKKEKDKYEGENSKKKDAIRAAAIKQAETEVYKQHGYVFYENKWQAAKPLLDKIVDDDYQRSIKFTH